MTDILDSFKTRKKIFLPESMSDYMALQLARKLSDTDNLWKYRSMFDHHSLLMIVEAFSNVSGRNLSDRDLVLAFEEELAALTSKEDDAF